MVVLCSAIAVTSILGHPEIVVSEDHQTTEITLTELLTKSDVETRTQIVMNVVSERAAIAGVSADKVFRTLKCENDTFDPERQSEYRYKRNNPHWNAQKGTQEQSYGLAMIHLPSHPTITREQAQDADFAIDFIIKRFKQGKQSEWTCYRNIFGA